MSATFRLHGEQSTTTPLSTTTTIPITTLEQPTRDLPWFMSISTPTRPRCFRCGGRLLPKLVVIQANHALCDFCARHDNTEYRPFWDAIERLAPPLEISRSRGIIFWTPSPSLPDTDGYLRWLHLWNLMIATPQTDRPPDEYGNISH